jgi:hypothetical protein
MPDEISFISPGFKVTSPSTSARRSMPLEPDVAYLGTGRSSAPFRRLRDSLIVFKNGTRYAYKYPSGSAYTLPIATTSILGGVKDGRGVSIASDGTINAEVQTFAQN